MLVTVVRLGEGRERKARLYVHEMQTPPLVLRLGTHSGRVCRTEGRFWDSDNRCDLSCILQMGGWVVLRLRVVSLQAQHGSGAKD